MMSLGELQISFPLFLYQYSPNDIITGNFDSEKVDQDEFFYYKECNTFLLRMTQILQIPKNYI